MFGRQHLGRGHRQGVHIFAYGVDSDFIPAMEIRVASGRNFGADPAGNEIIVNEELVEKMQWDRQPDRENGTLVPNSAHDRRSGRKLLQPAADPGTELRHTPFRADAGDGEPDPDRKTRRDYPGKTLRNSQAPDESVPSTDITVDIYREVIRAQYENELHFRNTVFVGVIVTLLISLIGLVGYTNNEIQRRSKEIAIRKVNGATASSIVRLIARDLQWITLAALVAGFAGAYLIGGNWLLRFATKTPLNIGLFAGCGLTVCAIIAVTVILKTRRTACENPVKSIKKNNPKNI